jgi:copper chaperone CopZ
MTHFAWTIPNMTCPACVMHLENLEDELPGILSIKASYHKKRLEGDYDESQVSEGEIRQAVVELGYEIA